MKKFKLLFITTFFVLQLSAQSFENIESLIGLSGLEDNNGVAVADYDNDQDLDFFIVAKAKEGNEYKAISRLFRNNNDGSFTDVSLESGLVSPILDMEWDRFNVGLDGVKLGASWGDFNKSTTSTRDDFKARSIPFNNDFYSHILKTELALEAVKNI